MAFFSAAAGSLLRRRAVSSSLLLRALSSSSATPIDAGGYHLSGGPSHMRAAVFWGVGKPLSIEDFQMPRPKAGEILIKTKACGVCHSELHLMKGAKFPTPCVAGHEISGEVVEHGAHTDSRVMKRLPIGSHVVGAYIMPCGNCFFCVKGQEDLCEVFNECNRANGTLYDGETRLFLRNSGKPVSMFCMGGLSEYCVVPATALATIPDSLPYSESAILGCAAFTAYGAMRNAAELRSGDSVAVIGVGGVGSSCLQVARAFGATEIIAVDISDEKLNNAFKFGATHTVNALKEDVVDKIKEITGGMGVDVAVEVLGRPSTFMQCLKSVRDGGKAVMVGFNSTGEGGEVDITRLVRRQIKIIGSYGARPRQDLPQIVKLAESGAFNIQNTVSRKCKLEEVNSVYADLDQGKVLGRAVIELS